MTLWSVYVGGHGIRNTAPASSSRRATGRQSLSGCSSIAPNRDCAGVGVEHVDAAEPLHGTVDPVVYRALVGRIEGRTRIAAGGFDERERLACLVDEGLRAA